MKRNLLTFGLLAVCLAMVAASPPIGEPRIERWVIGGGGGNAKAGGVSLHSTVGQWIGGSGAGGDFRLQHGFWSGAATATENHALYLPMILD